MKKLILSLLLSTVFAANAGTVSLSWTNPTTRTDGSPIPVGELSAIIVQTGTCVSLDQFDVKLSETTVSQFPTPRNTLTLTLNPGTYCFRAASIDSRGVQSTTWSNTVYKIIDPAPLNPPSNLTATVTTQVAYTVLKQIDKFVLAPVGTVPIGSPCDTAQSINGYNVVSRTLVKWSGSVRPDVVVAKCT